MLKESTSESWYALSQLHKNTDNDRWAIQCLKKALECDERNLDVLLALAVSETNEMNNVGAEVHMTNWFKYNPLYEGLNVDGKPLPKMLSAGRALHSHDP